MLLVVGVSGLCLLLYFAWKLRCDSKTKIGQLEQRIHFLELALNASSGGTWSLDIPTSHMSFDKKFKSILGYGPEELEASPSTFLSLCHREDYDKVVQYFQDYSNAVISSFSLKFRMRAKDGSYRWILSEAAAAKDATGKITKIVGWHRDVTEDVIQAELISQHRAQMAQTAKMSALGEMSGGIAHEINNPLAIISGTAQLIEAYLAMESVPLEKLKSCSERIQGTVLRISRIVKSLKSIARDASDDPFEDVAVISIIEDTLSFSKERIIKKGIEFRESIHVDGARVSLRSSEIVQVLVNLLNNALDEVELHDNGWIALNAQVNGDFVEISVENSGPAVSEWVQSKLFQPFFTTKEVGKGTGLGLSISKGLVERNDSKIFYDQTSPHPRFVVSIPLLKRFEAMNQ